MRIAEILREEASEFNWHDNKLALMLSLLAISTTLGPLPSTSIIYYAALVLVFFYSITKSSELNSLCIWFALAGATSIFFNNTPSLFNAPVRYAFFMIVFIIASPLLMGEYSRVMRYQLLLNMSKLCAIVGVLSFACYFLGINYMINVYTGQSDFLDNVGLFGGITKHSMLLGPMSGIGAVYCGYKALFRQEKLYWLPVIACMACTMFSASRSAFLASLGGIVAMIYSFSLTKSQFFSTMAKIGVVVLIAFPIWNSAMIGLEEKNQRNIEAGGMTSSRESKWENRLDEFRSSPAWGIGFCTVDMKNTGDYSQEGGVESGNSWLTVLSTMGLFGFIPFILLMWKGYSYTFHWKTRESALLSGLLIFIMLHMLAEGYIIYAGNSFCIIAWLIIGVSFDNQFRPMLEDEDEEFSDENEIRDL